MSTEIISTLLEWNPWFEDGLSKELTGIPRDYDVLSYIDIPEIKILEGVRRSGKSTLLYQVIQHAIAHGKKALYINFDDVLLRKFTLSEIYYAFIQYSSIDYLLIDEIQHCEDWVPFVRKFYDRKELQQIWITGSNSSLIKKDYAELLTGRNIKLTIAPLSFSEYLKFKGLNQVQFPMTQKKASQVKQLFNEYLSLGSFPAVALRKVHQRELLNNYFEDFIYKDIASRYDVNINKMKDLAIYLATNATKLFSYRNIAKALEIHPSTVNDYISHLKDIFLFDEVYKFDYSLKKQFSNDKKAYMIDTGLANTISFRFSEDKGRILENAVYTHLKRHNTEIYFHRDKKECDFILKHGTEIFQAIQVTSSLQDPVTKDREIAGLIEAIKNYRCKVNYILTLDESGTHEIEVDDETYQIMIKPVWLWMLEN